MRTLRAAGLGALTIGVGVLVGCAQPRIVTNLTGSPEQVKMITVQNMSLLSAGGTGLVQCERAADGTLTDCKKIPIVFNDGKGGAK